MYNIIIFLSHFAFPVEMSKSEVKSVLNVVYGAYFAFYFGVGVCLILVLAYMFCLLDVIKCI